VVSPFLVIGRTCVRIFGCCAFLAMVFLNPRKRLGFYGGLKPMVFNRGYETYGI